MTKIKFNEVWSIVIKPYLERELSLDNSLQILNIAENSEARRNIESLYDMARAAIKRDFMKDYEKLLDRHKIPACFYSAMVNAPVIKVAGGCAEKEMLVNSKLAFYAASSILLSFMACSEDANYSQFLRTKGLQYPQSKSPEASESYIVQTIKELCYAQKNKVISPIMLANIFCLLEAYTDLAYTSSLSNTL